MLTSTYNNAFYTRTGVLGHPGTNAIVFGNGRNADFAWDGDVAVHELTHALMHANPRQTLGRVVRDALGIDVTPRGAHEGLADYFAMAMTGDPYLGEWLGPKVGRSGFEPIRNLLDTQAKCFADYTYRPIGEEHSDGEPIAAALWQARSALALVQRPLFDKAVFNAVRALGEGDTFATISSLVVAETTVGLGEAAAATALSALAARQVNQCQRVLPFPPPNDSPVSRATGDSYWVFTQPANEHGGLAPQPVQYRFKLETSAPQIHVVVGSDCANSGVFLKRAAPVAWDWTGPSPSNDGLTPESVRNFGMPVPGSVLREVVARFKGPLAAGTYYVQLANTEDKRCSQLGLRPVAVDGALAAYSIEEPVPRDQGNPGDRTPGICDLSTPKTDYDCYDGKCIPGLQNGGDPDCGPDGGVVPFQCDASSFFQCWDGVCTTGMFIDADCNGRCESRENPKAVFDLDCAGDAGVETPIEQEVCSVSNPICLLDAGVRVTQPGPVDAGQPVMTPGGPSAADASVPETPTVQTPVDNVQSARGCTQGDGVVGFGLLALLAPLIRRRRA